MYERRLGRLAGALVALLGLAGARAFQLQVVEREEHLAALAAWSRPRFTVLPRRGEILYRDGRPMAANEPHYSVHVAPDELLAERARCGACGHRYRVRGADRPCPSCRADGQAVPEPRPSVAALAELLGEEPDRFEAAFARALDHARRFPHHRLHVLLNKVDRERAMALALAADRFPGIEVTPVCGRRTDPAAAAVAGRVRTAYAEDVERLASEAGAPDPEFLYSREMLFRMVFGDTGLERRFEDRLRGVPGIGRHARGRGGDEADVAVVRPVVDGTPVRTTLVREVQHAAHEVVSEAPGDAAVVVLDVADGAVVGLASKSRDAYHHAVTRMVPGSVFKLVTAVALLEAGLDPHESLDCGGRGRLPSGLGYNCEGVHPGVTLEPAFAKSCNYYFMRQAQRAGSEAMTDAARRLGFDRSLRLGLTGSTAGLEDLGAPWPAWDLAYVGIGQGRIDVTPLQVATAYARLAAGGRRVTPWLVVDEGPPPGSREVDPVLARHAERLQAAARRVVSPEGTARRVAQLLDLGAAGKSGTGEVPRREGDPGHAGLRFVNNAWFVGYAPADDPRYVAVYVQERVLGHGAEACGAAVGRLLEEALRER